MNAKYFIGHKIDRKNRPLFIELPKMIGLFNRFEKCHYMSSVMETKNRWKNINQFRIGSATSKEKKLINNQFLRDNDWTLD